MATGKIQIKEAYFMRKKAMLLLIAIMVLVPTVVFAGEVWPPVLSNPTIEAFGDSAILNPPLDPVQPRVITPFSNNIVDVIFVCNRLTSDSLPRDLVISTPGSFTISGRGTMSAGAGSIFNGWRD